MLRVSAYLMWQVVSGVFHDSLRKEFLGSHLEAIAACCGLFLSAMRYSDLQYRALPNVLHEREPNNGDPFGVATRRELYNTDF